MRLILLVLYYCFAAHLPSSSIKTMKVASLYTNVELMGMTLKIYKTSSDIADQALSIKSSSFY